MRLENVIDGRLVGAARFSEVLNPATLEPVGLAPVSDAAALDTAVAAGQGALGGAWADGALRTRAMARLADLIEAQAEELARLLSLEQGKVLAAARVEIGIALRILRHYAAWDEQPETLRRSAQEHVFTDRQPVGVAGLIVPWNYPLAILFMKLGPALRAGNAVVVKPAPTTPLTTLRLAQLAAEVLPPGVFNTLTGGIEVGQGLTTHPSIAKVSFTGSTATGRAVMAAAAPTLKRLTLELGGNDAAIVLPDADVARTAQRLYASAFSNAGQVCAAVKRVYVHRSVHDDLVAALEGIASGVRVGEGLAEEVQMGPVHSAMQRDFVQSLVQDARAAGARVHDAGPDLPDLPGHFLRPAIVSGLSPDAPLVLREQFGPALPVIAFDHTDEAIAAANASEFGLGASVWSADSAAALSVARRLEAGSLYINSHALPPDPAVPFGGVKQSGLGYELGDWGIDEFSLRRVIRVEALPGEVL
jgi:NAD-dependent aldehyde dehydrogenases